MEVEQPAKDVVVEDLALRYKRMDEIQQILERPNIFVGSVQKESSSRPVLCESSLSELDTCPYFETKTVDIVPGFLKIIDEILDNCVDNKQRNLQTMTFLDVEWNEDTGRISFCNNGCPIPIEIHPVYEKWIPSMIFGELRTSSNYGERPDDKTIGTNGLGAKLANIFSREFKVQIRQKDQYFEQCFKQNMSEVGEAVIGTFRSSKGDSSLLRKQPFWTKVSFVPDFPRFADLTGIPRSATLCMVHRLFEIQNYFSLLGGSPVRIFWNGQKLRHYSMLEYCLAHIPCVRRACVDPVSVLEKTEMWKKSKNRKKMVLPIEIFPNESSSDSEPLHAFQLLYVYDPSVGECVFFPSTVFSMKQYFVNGVSTHKGGSLSRFMSQLLLDCKSKSVAQVKTMDLETHERALREALYQSSSWILNVTIENPQFNAQTKEALTTALPLVTERLKKLRSNLMKLVADDPAMDKVVTSYVRLKTKTILSESDGKKTRYVSVSKASDALHAGTANACCALFIVEGDSAKTFIDSGLPGLVDRQSVSSKKAKNRTKSWMSDRNCIGKYCLTGKPPNVDKLSVEKLAKQKIFKELKELIGLKVDSQRPNALRYQKIVIVTDADTDGQHIAALLIGFFFKFWPTLCVEHSFLSYFRTYVGQAFLGKKVMGSFFSEVEQRQFYNRLTPAQRKGMFFKHIKGLGNTSPELAKHFFANIEQHIVDLRFDYEKSSSILNLLFGQKQGDADRRKQWIGEYDPHENLDESKLVVAAEDYIGTRLREYSMHNCYRALPGMEGVKLSQRQILYCEAKLPKGLIKVAQFGAMVAKDTNYPHGEQNLNNTSLSLMQACNNNIPLLKASGQCGTRSKNGKDAASPRYVFTGQEKMYRLIFPRDDDSLWELRSDEGEVKEPLFLFPIFPIDVVNGTEGIGTGWRCEIPRFHPRDVCRMLLSWIDSCTAGTNLQLTEHVLVPWYAHYRGQIVRCAEHPDEVHFFGQITETPLGFWITEIPPSVSVSKYEEFLQSLQEKRTKEKKKPPAVKLEKDPCKFSIQDYVNNSSDNIIMIFVRTTDSQKRRIHDLLDQGIPLHDLFKLRKKMKLSNINVIHEFRVREYSSVEKLLLDFFHWRLYFYEKRKARLVEIQKKELVRFSNLIRYRDLVVNGSFQIMNRPLAEMEKELKDKGFEYLEDSFQYLLKKGASFFSEDGDRKLQDKFRRISQEYETISSTPASHFWKSDLENFIREWEIWYQKKEKKHQDTWNKCFQQTCPIEPALVDLNDSFVPRIPVAKKRPLENTFSPPSEKIKKERPKKKPLVKKPSNSLSVLFEKMGKK